MVVTHSHFISLFFLSCICSLSNSLKLSLYFSLSFILFPTLPLSLFCLSSHSFSLKLSDSIFSLSPFLFSRPLSLPPSLSLSLSLSLAVLFVLAGVCQRVLIAHISSEGAELSVGKRNLSCPC